MSLSLLNVVDIEHKVVQRIGGKEPLELGVDQRRQSIKDWVVRVLGYQGYLIAPILKVRFVVGALLHNPVEFVYDGGVCHFDVTRRLEVDSAVGR